LDGRKKALDRVKPPEYLLAMMTPDELRDEISKRGWDQRTTAEILGVTEAAVSLWVNGRRPIPGPVAAALRGTAVSHSRRRKPSKS
jgi:hypothetical protein